MHRHFTGLAALSISLLVSLTVGAQPVGADEPGSVTAIDILLDPDATMIQHAVAANQRLRKNFPEGFALGKEHQPHISVLQRYVRTADLDKVYDAVGKVLAGEKPTSWKLKAYKYYYIPWKDIGLAGIVIEPTDDLIRYQQKLVDAVAPFTVKRGAASAFVTTKEDPEINQPTIDYVENFVPDETGGKYNPHVTIGGHLKVCAPNNANSDKKRSRGSNGVVAFPELRFEVLGHGQGGLPFRGEAA